MLEILAFEDPDDRGFTLTDMARRMGMAPNSARNLLKTMIVCGFVEQDAEGRYTTGLKCRQLGLSSRRQALVDLALPFLQKLGAALEEVVLLAVLVNGRRVTVEQVNPQRTIRVDPSARVILNPYELATGRILLAFASEAERRQVINRYGLPGAAWDGIRSESALRAALDALRRAGVCPMEKKEDGLMAFAVPVVAGDGSLIGALGCYAPTFRCPASKGQSMVEEMKRTATAMAEQMAGTLVGPSLVEGRARGTPTSGGPTGPSV